MQTAIYIVIGLAILVGLFFVVRAALRSYLRYRGTRIVTCPETEEHVAVEADALHAATGAVKGRHQVRLRDCTRWPERQDCGQECLAELEESPEDCLLRNILQNWYQGQKCVFCQRSFGEIHWHDHKPALLDSEAEIHEWSEYPPEKLPDVLDTHRPVCWNCLIAEQFRKEHPELVLDR